MLFCMLLPDGGPKLPVHVHPSDSRSNQPFLIPVSHLPHLLFSPFLAGLIGFALLLISATGALAQTTNTWTGQTGSDWNTAANWSRTAVPGTGDDVVIPAGTTNAPILSTTAAANSVEVQTGASLTISSSGSLSINGSKSYGAFSSGFSNSGQVRNAGRLVLGNTGSVGYYGLYNDASFTNTASGSIQIDQTSNTGLYNNTGGHFVNSATIVIGSVASVGLYGLYNASSFTNTAGGIIQIDRSSNTGLYNNTGGHLVNSATIVLGSVANAGVSGLYNASSFTNTAGGIIQIDRTSSYGLNNDIGGSFVNSAPIAIGSVANAGVSGLYNASSFTNTAGGIIQIDRTSNAGLHNNMGGSFVNSATIVLGSVANAGVYGLYNASSFTNTAGGLIQIDRTSSYGLNNDIGGSFVNSATILIGSLASVGGTGLYNTASFTNTAGGHIRIDQCTLSGLSNNSGSFVNSASIIIGSVTDVGNFGLINQSSFSNVAGSTLFIDRTGTSLSNSNSGSIVNQATITIGASTTGNAISNFAVFNNQGCQALINSLGNAVISGGTSFSNTGTIIERSSGNSSISYNGGLVQDLNGGNFSIGSGNTAVTGAGLFWRGCVSSDWNTAANWSAGTVPTATDDVTIPPGTTYSPILSTTAVANSVEVQTGASFTISSSGSLSINGSKSYGAFTRGFSNSGQVRNAGRLVLGNTGSVGVNGLYNAASFSNTAGGVIRIDRADACGLYNRSGGSFVNSATIVIGSLAEMGVHGLYNEASFTNTAAGNIQIDQTSYAGLYTTQSGSFVNSATIVIGSLAGVGSYGLINESPFTNTAGGNIQIDRAFFGLDNSVDGNIVNSATITIGASVTGLATFNYGLINNQGCQALINSLGDAAIFDFSSFSNTGTIIEHSSDNSFIGFNGGLVLNLNGGTFDIETGQPPLSVSATGLTTCNPVNGSFTITGVQPATAYTLSYTVGNTTASLALTGNSAGQLSAANLSGGTYALALSGSCFAQTLPLSATLGAPSAFTLTTQPPATSVVCAGAAVSATVGVSGTTAPVTYQWYKNTLASPVTSQTAAILSLTNLTAAESGSYFVVITDNCSSATSTAFSLTVNTISGFTVSSATVCPGQSANLTASGCSGQILWSTGATTTMITLTAGNSTSLLTATCTAGVCSATATGQVVVGGIQPPPAQILSFTADESACPVRLTGRGVATSFTMTGPKDYVFSTIFREGATHEAVGLNVKQAGTYTLTATYTNSCGTSAPVTRTVTVGRNCP